MREKLCYENRISLLLLAKAVVPLRYKYTDFYLTSKISKNFFLDYPTTNQTNQCRIPCVLVAPPANIYSFRLAKHAQFLVGNLPVLTFPALAKRLYLSNLEAHVLQHLDYLPPCLVVPAYIVTLAST